MLSNLRLGTSSCSFVPLGLGTAKVVNVFIDKYVYGHEVKIGNKGYERGSPHSSQGRRPEVGSGMKSMVMA